MEILLILVLVMLVLGLFVLAARRLNHSDTTDMINESICLSAGMRGRGGLG